MRSLRSLFGAPVDRANSMPVTTKVLASVASRVVVARMKCKEPCVVDVRIRNGRPVATAVGEEDGGGGIIIFAADYIPSLAFNVRPFPNTLEAEAV